LQGLVQRLEPQVAQVRVRVRRSAPEHDLLHRTCTTIWPLGDH
jgi:hypothetical protein